METIGDRIRKRRIALKLTQGQVAKGGGLSVGAISDMENGYQKSSTKLHNIASFLKVRVQWLETGEGPMDGEPLAIRESAPSYSAHGVLVTLEGARLGAEWDKIEGEEYKKLAREFIEGIVAAQKRAHRDVGPAKVAAKGKRSERPRHHA